MFDCMDFFDTNHVVRQKPVANAFSSAVADHKMIQVDLGATEQMKQAGQQHFLDQDTTGMSHDLVVGSYFVPKLNGFFTGK